MGVFDWAFRASRFLVSNIFSIKMLHRKILHAKNRDARNAQSNTPKLFSSGETVHKLIEHVHFVVARVCRYVNT